MNKLLIKTSLGLLLLAAQTATYAGTGNLFNVTSSGDATSATEVTVCLNATAGLSCQKFPITGKDISVTTTIARNYPDAGIKVNDTGFSVSGCTMLSNGYCSFAANNTTPATFTVQSPNIYSIGNSCPGGTCVPSFVRDATKVTTSQGSVILAVGSSVAASAVLDPIFWSSAAQSGSASLAPSTMFELPAIATGETNDQILIASAITRDGTKIASRALYLDGATKRRQAVIANVDAGSNGLFSSPSFTNTLIPFGSDANRTALNNITESGMDVAGFANGSNPAFIWNSSTGTTPLSFGGLSVFGLPVARQGISSDGVITAYQGTTIPPVNNRGYIYNKNTTNFVALSPVTGSTEIETKPFAMLPDGSAAYGAVWLFDGAKPRTVWATGRLVKWDTATGTPTVLGTPNEQWSISEFGGVTTNGGAVVVEFAFEDSVAETYTEYFYLYNSHGFFDLFDVMRSAGVNFDGWVVGPYVRTFAQFDAGFLANVSINGVTPDGTLIFGALPRTATPTYATGFVAEVPAGFLENYAG